MQVTPDKVRNILLAGHASSGKTNLVEALLFKAGASDRLGSTTEGNTVCDFEPEEIRRKSSISAAVAPFDVDGYHVNLIDAPGLYDFGLGLYEGIMACDTVLIPVSARSGLSVGAIKASNMAVKYNKSRIFFVSKIGDDEADFDKTVHALRDEFGPCICPVFIPVKEAGKKTVYVDVLDMRAFTYDEAGNPIEVAFSQTENLNWYINELNEAVAEADEALMDKFFAGEPFTREELVEGLLKGVVSGATAPVICGDSLSLEGIASVLRNIRKVAPAPSMMPAAKGVDADGNEVEVPCDPNGPLVVQVFKTVADPFVGKLSYVKVMSGTLKAGAALTNANTGNPERMGKLLSVMGKKQTDVNEISAGDLGAITKLAETKTGDTLCGSKLIKLDSVKFPKPTMSMAVYAKKKGDEGKVVSAIQKLLEEDRTASYSVNSETNQQILSGLGDQHLDVIVDKLKTKFGVEVVLEPPRIAYRETIRATAEAEGKHKKQSGGAGQYGVVQMRFEPLTDGTEFEFVNAVVGGAVPKEFIPAVEKGLREAMVHGVLAGYPMVGIKATLYDGKYHPVDSKEVAFKSAARLAYKAACAAAKPAILEPVSLVKTVVPDANTGDIMGDVTKRRGRVLGMSPAEAGLQLIESEIPDAELQDYTTYIRSVTQGRGYYTSEFVRYEPLPAHLEQKVIAEAEKVADDED